jgi:membrane-associated phospholipid phosphatase
MPQRDIKTQVNKIIKRRDDYDPSGENPVEEVAQELVSEARREVETARVPWHRVVRGGRILLAVDMVLLLLFGLLTWWVHIHPVLSIDVTITREFQENQAAWLKYSMIAVSFQGNTFWLNIVLIALAAGLFWAVDLRLEAIVVVLNTSISAILNVAIKALVDRPRPTAHLVDIIQGAGGPSFPSGHVMSYVAFWGLLFSFGIILFRGTHWWRIALMAVSALMFVLVGPSRIYLGDHWASDVLGAYLIGGALLVVALWLYLLLKERGVLAPRRRYAWYRGPSHRNP